jgi:hypothetical protein
MAWLVSFQASSFVWRGQKKERLDRPLKADPECARTFAVSFLDGFEAMSKRVSE